ncbi:MAG: zinc ribbon domain-containing protein [Fidelibacterota bacterium]
MVNQWIIPVFLFSFYLQAEPVMDPVNINIYSEYYYNGVMVEIETIVEFDQDTADISFTIPAGTDSVFLIKGIPSQDSKIIPIDLDHLDRSNMIKFPLSEPQFRLFIFFNPFDEGHEKSFTYPIGSNIQMKNVHIAIQEPVMAEDFSISREISSESNDQHGIKFASVNMGDINVNTVETVSVKYLNHTGKTTIETLKDQLRGEAAPKTDPHTIVEEKPKRHTLLLWEPMAILGVLSLIIGIMFYSKNKKTTLIDGKRNYCHSCGSKLNLEDKFCSNCGEKLS